MASQGEDVVKSVGRVFEVLELFDAARESLNATQVERELGYPQSSTLALLKSMVKLGYLSFDRINRSYFPTMRIATLGQWIESSSYSTRRLTGLIQDIQNATGETVSISCENDLAMQFLQVYASTRVLTVNIKPGQAVPLFGSVVGIAALAVKPDDEIALIADRVNRRARGAVNKVDLPSVRDKIAQAREDGYALGYNSWVDTIGALAWVLPADAGVRPIILSVAGPTENIREEKDDIARKVKAALRMNR